MVDLSNSTVDSPLSNTYDKHMHRTMIYIDDVDHRLLQKKAKLTGHKMSALIREAIQYYLDKVVKRTPWESDPLWSLSGIGKADQPNKDSIEHDKILYGSKG